MQSRALHRWTLLGTFAATVAFIGPGCNRDRPLMPRAGSSYEGIANTQQPGPPMEPMRVSSGSGGGTGGSGSAGTTAAEDGAGAQGHTNKIGAPGYTTSNEDTRDPGGTRQFIQGHHDTE
ncbi:hypothetical protein [Corallococcus sp. CA047B]|uniref:hypothetical protein n=1 Tax=Corallococcus sp. CA047B TaxID=2316729 RepID=UPI000EA2577A|nr:hypothetical protein [Corallococcus sp. CA047B]